MNQQIPKEFQQLPPNPQQQIEEQKRIVYIENLDQGISEDYLYRKFKQVGDIWSLKILRNKTTKKSKGKAFITFAHKDQAEEAIKTFNNIKFIKNVIRVEPYVSKVVVTDKADILIKSLPDDVDPIELMQEFSRYGTVLSVEIANDAQGKLQNQGHVSFEQKQDAEKLLERIIKHPINYRGKILTLELVQSKKKIESSQIYLRSFAVPLTAELIKQGRIVRAIEYGWELIIKDHFARQEDKIKECFVTIDEFTRQPWALITFETLEQAQKHFDICEANKSHPCVNSSAHHALELIKKFGLPLNNFGTSEFELSEVEHIFEEFSKDPNDPFKGTCENFFFDDVNQMMQQMK